MGKGYRWLAGVLLALTALPAHAQFAMSEMIIDFPDKTPRAHDVEIISRSKDTQYIATETYVVEHPTEPNEKRVLISNPIKSGLLITPNKMVLPPQTRKTMRFLVIAPQIDKDVIYRVVVKPVIQGVDEYKKRVAIKVLVGYDALVIVRPAGAKVDLVGERKGNALTLTNKGNTNANLQGGQQCDDIGNNCKDLNVTRIYAGQSWTITLPYMSGAAKFRVWDGATLTDMTF
jgi:P pilus assembly chaperone PapD